MTPSSKHGPKRPSTRGAAGSRPGAARPSSSRKTAAKTTRTGRFTTRAVILMAVVLLLVASYTSSFHAWWQQRQEIQSTNAEIAMRTDAIKKLQDDQTRWNDRAFVEQQARERFGWVLPGEVGYRVIGSDGRVQGNVPTLDAPPVPKSKQWYDRLWGTVEQSGKSSRAKPVEPDPNKVLKK